jgi:hypothetical protein
MLVVHNEIRRDEQRYQDQSGRRESREVHHAALDHHTHVHQPMANDRVADQSDK